MFIQGATGWELLRTKVESERYRAFVINAGDCRQNFPSPMKQLVLLIVWCLWTTTGNGQKVKKEIFVLHNIIRGDAQYNTFEKQARLVKETGFDGLEINQTENFEPMKAALDAEGLKGSS